MYFRRILTYTQIGPTTVVKHDVRLSVLTHGRRGRVHKTVTKLHCSGCESNEGSKMYQMRMFDSGRTIWRCCPIDWMVFIDFILEHCLAPLIAGNGSVRSLVTSTCHRRLCVYDDSGGGGSSSSWLYRLTQTTNFSTQLVRCVSVWSNVKMRKKISYLIFFDFFLLVLYPLIHTAFYSIPDHKWK